MHKSHVHIIMFTDEFSQNDLGITWIKAIISLKYQSIKFNSYQF